MRVSAESMIREDVNALVLSFLEHRVHGHLRRETVSDEGEGKIPSKHRAIPSDPDAAARIGRKGRTGEQGRADDSRSRLVGIGGIGCVSVKNRPGHRTRTVLSEYFRFLPR